MRHQPDTDRQPAGAASGILRDTANPSSSPAWRRSLLVSAIGAAVLLAGGHAARAQISVEGPPEAIHVEVRDAPLRDVLAALHGKFSLHYRSEDALDAPVSGIFNGPLRRVAARILDGCDFLMKIGPERIDVIVLRQHQPNDKPVVAALPRGGWRLAPAVVMTAVEANRYERGQAR